VRAHVTPNNPAIDITEASRPISARSDFGKPIANRLLSELYNSEMIAKNSGFRSARFFPALYSFNSAESHF
jgi:hypothetical protein